MILVNDSQSGVYDLDSGFIGGIFMVSGVIMAYLKIGCDQVLPLFSWGCFVSI